jgi:signal transduction histidine kinase
MSQLETGSLEFHIVPVDVERIVREAGMAFEERLITGGFQEHRLELDVVDPDSRPPVQADPRLLRNAIDILLENALKYSPAGGIIRLGLQVVRDATISDNVGAVSAAGSFPVPEPADILIVSVEDSGIGIPKEHLERIFDHFHRVDTGLTREVSGLGLGLSICKRIMELHGGSVWGESAVGEGSTFFVTLPLDGWRTAPGPDAVRE